MYSHKKLINAIIALIALFVLVITSGCIAAGLLQKADITSIINYNGTGDETRVLEKRAETKVLSSEKTELYVDKKNGGISVYDRVSQKSWNSLPSFQNSFASNFTVTVLYGNELHILDTSGSLAEEDVTYAVDGDTLEVIYNLKAKDISLQLPVLFSLKGGYLEVSVNVRDCVLSEGARLISIAFLPYLGAVRYDSNSSDLEVLGDYYLVPDGPGATMRTAIENEVTSSVFSVYGKDYYEESIPASIGAYGVKFGNSALAVTVTAGAENSLIKVFRSNADEKEINRIYPEFIITDLSGENGKVNISKNSFDGKFTVVYETLSGDSADYIGMAVSSRQALINARLMTDETAESEYPLFVSVIGSADGSNDGTATSFQQAENLLSILKGKGINEINMILEGFFAGGLNESSAGNFKPLRKLGGAQDLEALTSYAAMQQLNVFSAFELLSTRGSVSAAKDIFGKNKEYIRSNPLYPYIGRESFNRKYSSGSKVSSSFLSALEAVSDFAFSGLLVLGSDVSCISDFSSENAGVSDYSQNLISNLSASSTKTRLMLEGANINIVKYADYLKGISLSTVIPESGEYSAVPFVPAVLHSSCIYAGESANTSPVPRLVLLKSVEYGAVPYYTWVASSKSDKYYELTLNDAVDFYLEAKEELGNLSVKRITDHYLHESGVYCTVYDGGTKVYVNYNNYSVLIGEVAVMPYDYLRIG
ncbi:MAG: hypothetical protein IKL10_03290 [Clostridia bacterium]|nr:hypothetical protein [Clostridia bacterium]